MATIASIMSMLVSEKKVLLLESLRVTLSRCVCGCVSSESSICGDEI